MNNPAPGFARHPGHRVDIRPAAARVRIEVAGHVIASSDAALKVEESRHDPVWYLPKADVDFSRLTATETSTYCPFKGQASYWSITAGEGTTLTDCVWAYETPFDECAALADHVAFYQDRVTVVEEESEA